MKIEYTERLVSADAGLSCLWVCHPEGFTMPFVIHSFFGVWLVYTPKDADELDLAKKGQGKSTVTVPHELTRGFLQQLEKDWGVSKHDLDKAALDWRKVNKHHGQPTPA